MTNRNPNRYDEMIYRRCGRSGLRLPAISIGCWHNFGDAGTDARHTTDETAFHNNAKEILFTAFDLGITHFDLANNYGPAPGAAETRVGRILREDLAAYRDELIISSKAGYLMWPGPYGEWGSRKYMLASLDQSLQRLGLDYVDIFYSHRPDPDTPLEETLGALDQAVRSGKAIYAGISSYDATMTREVMRICREERLARPIIHQPSYSMLNRSIENGLTDAAEQDGLGIIAFCPLAQGLLTGKYLSDIPTDSRAASEAGFLNADAVTAEKRQCLNQLNDLAAKREQSLAQMALAWVLRLPQVTSALIGASRADQVRENVAALTNLELSPEECGAIDAILATP
ncbi:MAG: aldo/keto reductase [Verrucomicrobia bacterium]|nr:aldo/keto reductase [Verrucomicrobiota bacterium]MDA1087648.1 aldo/keto reductase [Verrucomicrobiota bacterium]